MPRVYPTPRYRHHKASGQAVVTLSGKDHYLGEWNSAESRHAYDRKVSEWLAAGRVARDTQAVGFSCSQLALAYDNAGELTGSHERELRSLIRLWVQLYGPTAAASFDVLALTVIRGKLVEKGLKRRTVNTRVDQLRRVFRWGVAHGHIQPATLQALEAVEHLKKGKTTAPESGKVKPVSRDHVEACLKGMRPMLRDMVKFQLFSGMRAKEMLTMRTGDLSCKDGEWTYTPDGHKTQHHGDDHIRQVELGPRAMEVLTPYLKPDLAAYIFSPAEAEAERRAARAAKRKTPLGQGNAPGTNRQAKPRKAPGDRYTTDSYRRAIAYAIDRTFPPPADLVRLKKETNTAWRARLGPEKWAALAADRRLVRWTPHRIRHTFGQTSRDKFGLEHTQRAMGHATAKATEIYAEAARAKAREVANAIG